MKRLKTYIKKTPLGYVHKGFYAKVVNPYRKSKEDLKNRNKEINDWQEAGYPLPAPDAYKRLLIESCARQYKLDTLVETGTFQGETVDFFKNKFKTIYSIEVEPELYKKALKRFKRNSNVHILQGDSAVEIKKVLEKLKGPALFWLDAHYSVGITGKGKEDSSLRDEVLLIREQLKDKDHILLLDDARDFWGINGYPSVAEVMDIVYKTFPRYTVEMKHGIIVLAKV